MTLGRAFARLDRAVGEARLQSEWRKSYMDLAMKYQEKFDEGLEQGREQGLEQPE